MSTISVEPTTVSIIPGRKAQFEAIQFDGDGSFEAESGFEWSVDDPTIIRVNGSGEVLGLKAGVARVFASLGGLTGEGEVRVVLDDNVTTVQITPAALAMAVGDLTRLTALAYNAYGELITGDLQFWSSSDVSVASVDSNGLVSALESGSAEISVEIGSSQASIQVTVA